VGTQPNLECSLENRLVKQKMRVVVVLLIVVIVSVVVVVLVVVAAAAVVYCFSYAFNFV